jgi:hypothetical protein
LVATLGLAAACEKAPPPAPPPAPAPAAPVAAPVASSDAGAPKPKLAPAPSDGLSLAERIERRQAQEAREAAQNASDEKNRLLKYDKAHLKEHGKVFAFILSARKSLDSQKSKEAVAKAQAKMQKPLVAMAKQMAKIDPKGGNSNVVTDYDVMLNLLANEYPDALMASFDGDKGAIAEQRQEMDKRTKKVTDWLAEVKKSK